MSGPTPLAIAADMAARFERHGVRYVLGGSMASAVFGEPRSTLDIGFAADLSALTIEPWLADVRTEFGLDEAWARTEVARRGSFQMMHRRELVRIDVFVPPWTGIHEWKWRTRRRIQPLTSSPALDVTSPAEIVLQKLCWYRAGGEVSERQWRDVIGVLKAQSDVIDRGELRTWAATVRVDDLLRRAEAESNG
ncbi:MAG: hypothetical protein ACK5BN_17825 [Planctomycetota bacterium]